MTQDSTRGEDRRRCGPCNQDDHGACQVAKCQCECQEAEVADRLKVLFEACAVSMEEWAEGWRRFGKAMAEAASKVRFKP